MILLYVHPSRAPLVGAPSCVCCWILIAMSTDRDTNFPQLHWFSPQWWGGIESCRQGEAVHIVVIQPIRYMDSGSSSNVIPDSRLGIQTNFGRRKGTMECFGDHEQAIPVCHGVLGPS